jgi:hypothetical protein
VVCKYMETDAGAGTIVYASLRRAEASEATNGRWLSRGDAPWARCASAVAAAACPPRGRPSSSARGRRARPRGSPASSKVLGLPKRCKLAHAFLWDGYKRLKLAQLLGQLGVFLTCATCVGASISCGPSPCPGRSGWSSASSPSPSLGVGVEVILRSACIFSMGNH